MKKKTKKKQLSLSEYAIRRLERSGSRMVDVNIDDYYLKLPRNITTVSGKDLGEYLYAFTQQKAYLKTLVAVAEAEMIELSTDYDNMYTKVYNESVSTSVNDRKEVAKSNPLVQKYREELDKAEAVVKLAAAEMDSYNDVIFALSREITRRERMMEQEKRDHNVGTKKREYK